MTCLNPPFLAPFLTALAIAFLATPIAIKLGWKMGLVSQPSKKRIKDTHTYPVPRGGGLPIVLALILTALFFLPLDKHLTGILLGALLATIVGLVDDCFDINPYLRLLTCFLAAGVVVAAGLSIAF